MMRLGNAAKRCMGVGLSVAMALTFAPAPVFADPIAVKEVDQRTYDGDGNNFNIHDAEYGDVYNDYKVTDTLAAAHVESTKGNIAEVTIGNITSASVVNERALYVESTGGDSRSIVETGEIKSVSDGVEIKSENNGSSEVTVHGDVNASQSEYNFGAIIETNEGGTADLTVEGSLNNELRSQINEDGKSEVKIKGNVTSAKANGVEAYVKANGESSISIGGSINSADESGIMTGTINSGTQNIEVEGDVSAKADGVSVLVLEKGMVNVKVGGNISGGGKTWTEWSGADLDARSSGSIDLHVDGNVTGENGLILDADGGTVNAYVGGTISGKHGSVVLGEGAAEDSINLTVWKIEPGEAGIFSSVTGYDDDSCPILTENKTFGSKVQYIIKVDQPSEGATLSAGKDTARESEMVTMRVALADGYSIKAAYSDSGKQTAVKVDGNGNYYAIVPKGGGVIFSVELDKAGGQQPGQQDNQDGGQQPGQQDNQGDQQQEDKAQQEKPSEQPSTEQTAADPADESYEVFNATAVQQIVSAAPGGTVLITTSRWTGISKEVVDALKERPDVAVTVTYVYDGVIYKVTIPAGVDLDALRNAAGGIDFLTLAALFGAPIV